MTRGSRWRSKLTETASMLVLGLGLLLLFEPGLAPIDFWVVWIVGFAVVVPIVELLLDADEDDASVADVADEDAGGNAPTETDRDADRAGRADTSIPAGADASTRDAIETLRERYARGDLTDEQFDRKLDRLLQTDTPENAAEWRDRTRARDRQPETGRDREREGGQADHAEPETE